MGNKRKSKFSKAVERSTIIENPRKNLFEETQIELSLGDHKQEENNFNLVEDDEDQHSHTEELSVAVEHDQQSVAHCPFSYDEP